MKSLTKRGLFGFLGMVPFGGAAVASAPAPMCSMTHNEIWRTFGPGSFHRFFGNGVTVDVHGNLTKVQQRTIIEVLKVEGLSG